MGKTTSKKEFTTAQEQLTLTNGYIGIQNRSERYKIIIWLVPTGEAPAADDPGIEIGPGVFYEHYDDGSDVYGAGSENNVLGAIYQ